MNIEEKIKQIIEEKHGSIAAFARNTGIQDQCIRNIINRGINRASFKLVTTICKELNIDPFALIDNEVVHYPRTFYATKKTTE